MEATAQIVEGFLARATYAEVSIKEGEALPKRKGWLSMFTLEWYPAKCSTLKKSRHVRVWLYTTNVPLTQNHATDKGDFLKLKSLCIAVHLTED